MLLSFLLPQQLPHEEQAVTHSIVHDWHAYVVNFVRDDLPKLLVIFLVAFIIQRVVLFFVNRMHSLADRQIANTQRASQLRTMAAILRATSYGVLGFIVLLQVLLVFGLRIEPLLASAGVVGVGIGLGAQSIFKDMLNGIFILVEDQYNVGEVVKIASLTGTVEDLTLRLTRLRDGDGTLYVIPNSQVAAVANYSRDFAIASLNISVDASADSPRVVEILTGIAHSVRSDPAFKDVIVSDPEVPGIDRINGRELIYPIALQVRVAQKDAVLRALRMRVVETFKKEHIPLGVDPANMLLIQGQKAAADPTAPPAPPTIGA